MITNSNLLLLLNLKEIPKNIKQYNRYVIIALAKNNIRDNEIVEFTNCSKEMVRRWKNHSGLNDEFRSGRPPIYGKEIETKVIGFYCQTKPMIDSGRWTVTQVRQ